MNIAIISRPRTVSTAVINTLAKRHNLTNEFENYQALVGSLLPQSEELKNLDNEAKEKYFKNAILLKTNKLFKNGNFICKIWPRMFMQAPAIMLPNWTIDQIKSKTIFDITSYYKIDQYDQLYFLDRNVYSTTASWAYSHKISVFHTERRKKHETPIIKLEVLDLFQAKFHVLEYVLQQKLKDFLIEKKIAFIDISNNTEDYVDESLLTTIKSEHDYPSLISNYNELYDSITTWHKFFVDATGDWKFT